MSLSSYKDLTVWQVSRSLAKDIYILASQIPQTETYGLISQVQRAAVSIPSNIAEGYRRNKRGEYVQFLGIASGSAAELETQLILINDIFSIKTDVCLSRVNEVQKMLSVLIRKLDPKR